MNNMDLAFGVWTPNKLVDAAKKYMEATSTPGGKALVRAGANQLTGFGATAPTPMPMPTQTSNDTKNVVVLALLGGVAILLGLRVAASWYVGKKIGHPTSGAIVGGIFGAPGLGVLSLFPGNKSAVRNAKKKSKWHRPYGWTEQRYMKMKKWLVPLKGKSNQELEDIIDSTTHKAKADAARHTLELRRGGGLQKTLYNLQIAQMSAPTVRRRR